jgi:hypothetical protein
MEVIMQNFKIWLGMLGFFAFIAFALNPKNAIESIIEEIKGISIDIEKFLDNKIDKSEFDHQPSNYFHKTVSILGTISGNDILDGDNWVALYSNESNYDYFPLWCYLKESKKN